MPWSGDLPNQHYVRARKPLGPLILPLAYVILVARTLEGCEVVPQDLVSCIKLVSDLVSCIKLVSAPQCCMTLHVSRMQHVSACVNTSSPVSTPV